MSNKYLIGELFALHAANGSSINIRQAYPGKQSGVVLFIALIALVAMTLAAIALVRSVETGNVVAGNLAFKQGATMASDAAIETAITALAAIADQPGSYNDNAAIGYYATNQANLDMTGSQNNPGRARVDWDNNNCAGTIQAACIDAAPEVALGNGYKARYIIHRMCSAPGNPGPPNCPIYESPATANLGGGRNAIRQGGGNFASAAVGYYRITTRVSGPRNTSSFVETILHF